MIDEADVFQLFWSSASSQSEFVEQEWRYALTQRKPNFVRPGYWEDPFPQPPVELSQLHFQQLPVDISPSAGHLISEPIQKGTQILPKPLSRGQIVPSSLSLVVLVGALFAMILALAVGVAFWNPPSQTRTNPVIVNAPSFKLVPNTAGGGDDEEMVAGVEHRLTINHPRAGQLLFQIDARFAMPIEGGILVSTDPPAMEYRVTSLRDHGYVYFVSLSLDPPCEQLDADSVAWMGSEDVRLDFLSALQEAALHDNADLSRAKELILERFAQADICSGVPIVDLIRRSCRGL
jgi:hypothetical protein